MIIDGEMVKRGTVFDEERIPEHMRTEKYVNKVDLSGRDNQVMLLHGLGYHREQMVDGTIMATPVFLTQGELIRLSDIPPRQREGLQEGVDYVTEWNEKERGRLRHEETKRELESIQPEPMKTYELGRTKGR
jgi:hypothetical protein